MVVRQIKKFLQNRVLQRVVVTVFFTLLISIGLILFLDVGGEELGEIDREVLQEQRLQEEIETVIEKESNKE